MFKTIAIGLSLLSVGFVYADTKFKSGQYEFIKMAVTPDNRIEGYYFEEMGEGVTRRCDFFFEGKINDKGKTYIKTYSVNTIDGVLNTELDGLFLEMADDHPGCSSVSGGQAKYGLSISLLAAKNWIGIGVAKADKIYLQSTAINGTEGKVYIVKNDTFGIIEVNDTHTLIEYINPNTDKSYKGWIKNSSYMSVKEAMGQ